MQISDLQQQFLTTREVADLLRVKERKVYDLAAADEIPHRRITGKLLFPAAELKAWIEGGEPIGATDRPAVITGSHDPLLDWAIRDSGCGLATLFNGSREGLDLFAAHSAALAGLHIPETENQHSSMGWNLKSVQDLGVTNSVLISWASRQRGLLVSDSARGSIVEIEDLKGKQVVLRQPGAGAGALFDILLSDAGLTNSDLKLTETYAHTETDAAVMVASGEAEVALGVEAMARQFKLNFVPLMHEQFDLLIDRKSYFTDPVQSLMTFAKSTAFSEKAKQMGGYDLSKSGTVRWLSV